MFELGMTAKSICNFDKLKFVIYVNADEQAPNTFVNETSNNVII